MSEKIGDHGESSEQRTQAPFPFLSLPAEIRNEVYRLVLLTQNVTTDELNIDGDTFTVAGERSDGVSSAQPGDVAVGTIRCISSRTYTMGYQIAILLTNRQIYCEAWGIFHLENVWTIIRVNKAGIGKDLMDHGFPVAIADNLWCHVKFPVMKVTVTFPSLEAHKQSEAFVLATVHLKQLMRALRTAKGASEMEVRIQVQPPRTENSPGERYLLRPFLKLRSIKRLVVLGASEKVYVDELTRAITTTDGIHQSLGEVAASVKRLQRYVKAEQWETAIEEGKKHSFLIADCKTVYGSRRFFGMEPGLNIKTAMARNQVAKEILIATGVVSGEATLYLGEYASAIDSADLGLNAIGRVFVFPHVPPVFPPVVAHPSHRLPSRDSIISSGNETRCNLVLIRARAYMGMQRAEDAFREIELARKLMPSSATLASVSRAWQVTFGPLPGSAPSPSSISL